MHDSDEDEFREIMMTFQKVEQDVVDCLGLSSMARLLKITKKTVSFPMARVNLRSVLSTLLAIVFGRFTFFFLGLPRFSLGL
jgi:hypothetical protein